MLYITLALYPYAPPSAPLPNTLLTLAVLPMLLTFSPQRQNDSLAKYSFLDIGDKFAHISDLLSVEVEKNWDWNKS